MKEEHYRIKEMRSGWFLISIQVIGFILLWGQFSWQEFIGISLLLIPFAYNNDLTRNYLRDYCEPKD